jgi:hypothetical protein
MPRGGASEWRHAAPILEHADQPEAVADLVGRHPGDQFVHLGGVYGVRIRRERRSGERSVARGPQIKTATFDLSLITD